MPPATVLALTPDTMPAPPADPSDPRGPAGLAGGVVGGAASGDVRSHEVALVRRAQRGDRSAFGTLVRLHQRRVYAVARAIVGTHEDAEDVVQEAWLGVISGIAGFEGRS